MEGKFTKRGVNLEKWVIFGVLLNLAILELTTCGMEYFMLRHWAITLLGLVRIASLILAIYAIATNMSSIIR